MESSHDIAEYRERRKFWRTVVAAAVCGGLALFSVGVYLLCRYVFPSDKISEFYTDKLFYYISWPIKKVIAYFPFSVAEIALYASIAAILFWFINMLVGTVRAGRRCYIRKKQNVPIEGFSLLRPLVQLVLRLSSFICVIVSAFVLFGGINYTSLTFSEKAGYELEEADVDQLSQLCRLLSARAAAARLTLALEADGTINENYADYNPFRLIDDALDAYQNLPEEYAYLKRDYPRAKLAVSSPVMSNIHITGIYPYIIPEAVVNAQTPIMSLPHTICHEMAHQRGFAREDEANYIAYLACIHSDNPLFVYSGYYTAFTYAMDQLYLYDQKSWQEISSATSSGIWLDNLEESNFWQQYQTVSSEFTGSVNDTYLTVMDVDDGVHSYGRMIDLILAEEKQKGTIQ
ncbi:MAG: hypothetical protein DBX53_05815 [Clostridiales bacterium]|nr:MAG: hypothetical protein DBX53_05815 [Clostridiales bacterium]